MGVKHFLTFDYEIFFGSNSGSVLESLFTPTQVILNILESNKAKATFFVDVLHFYKLMTLKDKYPALAGEARAFKEQIEAMVKAGHDVQLHVHPHWLDARFNPETTRWEFNYKNYRLHDLPPGDDGDCSMGGCFAAAKNVLVDLVRRLDPDYECICFRAGGYCILPFGPLKKIFTECGILVDSSVLPGSRFQIGQDLEVDFKDAPQLRYWFFDDDPKVPKKNGRFLELPIATVNVGKSRQFYAKAKRAVLRRNAAWQKLSAGSAMVQADDPRRRNKISYICGKIMEVYRQPSVDYFGCEIPLADMETIHERYAALCQNDDPMVLVGHPKNSSMGSLKALDQFIKRRVGSTMRCRDAYEYYSSKVAGNAHEY